MLFVRLIGAGKFDQLHLLKLVLADDSTHILAVRAGFGTEARGVSHQAHGQLCLLQHLVAIEVCDRHFGGRDQVKVGALALEEIRGKLG